MYNIFLIILFIFMILFLLIKDTNSFKNKPYIDNSKLGVVITTHGNNGILVEQCIRSYFKFLPKNTIYFLFVNESDDPITLSLKNKYTNIECIYISNQTKNGGLTATWNQGIHNCIKSNCNTIIISNDDLLIDSSIHHIIHSANNTPKNKLHYYGPVTNNPGPSILNQKQSTHYINTGTKLYNSNLNGFFMVFPAISLLKNKYDSHHYFNPRYPFDGAEVEWYNRFKKIGGKPILVSNTFVYHYKLQSWRNKKLNKKCLFTIEIKNENYSNFNRVKFDVDILYLTKNFKKIYFCLKHNLIPIIIFEDVPYNKLKELVPKNYIEPIFIHSDRLSKNIM